MSNRDLDDMEFQTAHDYREGAQGGSNNFTASPQSFGDNFDVLGRRRKTEQHRQEQLNGSDMKATVISQGAASKTLKSTQYIGRGVDTQIDDIFGGRSRDPKAGTLKSRQGASTVSPG